MNNKSVEYHDMSTYQQDPGNYILLFIVGHGGRRQGRCAIVPNCVVTNVPTSENNILDDVGNSDIIKECDG
jgi:hypothetical protein